MLKDTVRTDAYRDFIYDNKHLFQGKVVLDVGCGTGILSMFCAKAGARMVISVDNSDIIEKARRIVYENGLQDQVKCLRGKIEEITLPVSQVDIIVSEWMGYCLLYESMLDSVIFARDKYLKPGGLMVPSHATIMMAPLHDSELTEAHVDFWKNVYGFDMSAMLDKVYDEALTRVVNESEIASEACPILQLDLHQASVADLDFRRTFRFTTAKAVPVQLEGFVIWFDIFFMGSRQEQLDPSLVFKQAQSKALVAFSTGPACAPTHWQQGILLINGPRLLEGGQLLDGHITFRKMQDHGRALEIIAEWGEVPRTQSWILG
jgi:protein arginine N-methyltransferase 3